MFIYEDLMGGLISVEFPYLIMILFGCAFAKTGIFHKEGTYSFAKLMVDMFIPVYLFINICRSTSVATIEKNYLLILSVLFQMSFAGLFSFAYVKITNMDIRYRYTWIILNLFVDIKQVHRLAINSFCFHLKEKSSLEKGFCDNQLTYNYVHVFFQAVIIWYGAFNFIRLDRKYHRSIVNIQKEIGIEMKGDHDPILNRNVKLDEEQKKEVKIVYEKHFEDNENKKLKATGSFYNKIAPFYSPEETVWWRELIYVLFRSPLIAIFTGFVVGFITPIQEWIFNTKTAVYLFYDTFNSIGQTHIICAFLILGTVIYIKDETSVRFSRKDLIVHLVYKCIIQPFVGVLFSLIAHSYIPDNKVLNFACFIQWLLPTSIEIIAIAVSKDINTKDVCLCIVIQWVWLTCLSNFIVLPSFLKAVQMI